MLQTPVKWKIYFIYQLYEKQLSKGINTFVFKRHVRQVFYNIDMNEHEIRPKTFYFKLQYKMLWISLHYFLKRNMQMYMIYNRTYFSVFCSYI
jgi:hypothetical protein